MKYLLKIFGIKADKPLYYRGIEVHQVKWLSYNLFGDVRAKVGSTWTKVAASELTHTQ